LKFISDKFEDRRAELKAEGREKYLEMTAFYQMKNVFFLPEETRWSHIVEKAQQDDIALIIDTALSEIEKKNKALAGALPDNYFSRLGLDKTKLTALVNTIDNINTTADKQQDIVGRVYEYFLSKFALAEGKGKGEFYTPKSIVNLIAEMIEPYSGKIYDPCCGSGGMFVQSLRFIETHQGDKKDISIYGQEYTAATYKLAKMNLAVRGISADMGKIPANTFAKDQHLDLKADYIMANPPFNQKDWQPTKETHKDPRWDGFTPPPSSNANYAWILHIVSKLSENGIAGFILANGALSGGGDEYKIRKELIEKNLVEAIVILPQRMFYTTGISVTLWIINKNKKARNIEQNGAIKQYRERNEEVLFMDLREVGVPFEKKFIKFSKDNITDIADTLHTWQQNSGNYQDTPEYSYSATKAEIEKKDFSLVPSKYIEFINRDENIDFGEKMTELQSKFSDLLKAEKQSKQDLLNVFKELGYEIEL
jgi:type I restriction enzyme M protein